MSNPSKARGTAAETALLRWLHDNGHPEAVRNPPAGTKDVGDLRFETPVIGANPRLLADASWAGVIIEVKSWKDVARAINEGLSELDAEMVNAGTEHGVLVLKRRGTTDPGEWLAIRKVKNDPELGA